jgi:MFS family permease
VKGPERLRALFLNREYLAYFTARQCGWLAATIVEVAIGWQIFALRHSAFDLGLVGLTWFVPQFALALPAGLLADRVDRKRICIASAIVSLLCTLAYVALAYLHVNQAGPWFAALAVHGIAYATSAPAQRSILPQIVTGEMFIRASAFTISIAQVTTIAGPALAGLLIAAGVPFAFAAAVAVELCSAIAYGFLTSRPHAPPTAPRGPMLQSALDGVRYIAANPLVLGAISLDLFAVLFGGATALLPVFATQILHVGAVGFGLLNAAPAAGSAVVAIVIARRPLRRHGARWLFYCVAGFGVATIVFGLSKSFWLSFTALAFAGGFDMVSVSIRGALVQLRTPDEMRGRVSAVENIFIGASNQLGAFESGTVASLIGAVPCVVFGGVATLTVIALWAMLFPALRHFDRLTES